MSSINTYAFATATTADRVNIAEAGATYMASPATTSPILRAEEVARVAEQIQVARAMRGPRQVSAFWAAPAAPAAPPAA